MNTLKYRTLKNKVFFAIVCFFAALTAVRQVVGVATVPTKARVKAILTK